MRTWGLFSANMEAFDAARVRARTNLLNAHTTKEVNRFGAIHSMLKTSFHTAPFGVPSHLPRSSETNNIFILFTCSRTSFVSVIMSVKILSTTRSLHSSHETYSIANRASISVSTQLKGQVFFFVLDRVSVLHHQHHRNFRYQHRKPFVWISITPWNLLTTQQDVTPKVSDVKKDDSFTLIGLSNGSHNRTIRVTNSEPLPGNPTPPLVSHRHLSLDITVSVSAHRAYHPDFLRPSSSS